MKQWSKRLLDPHRECLCILDQAEPDLQRFVASVSGCGWKSSLGKRPRKAWRRAFREWVRNQVFMRLSSVVILVGEASHRREWFLWRKNLVSLRRGERLCLAECRTYQLTARVSTGAKLVRMCRQRFVVGALAPEERAKARTTNGSREHWSRCARGRAYGRLPPTGGHTVGDRQEHLLDAMDLAVLDLLALRSCTYRACRKAGARSSSYPPSA
jgi:hypothetical protein